MFDVVGTSNSEVVEIPLELSVSDGIAAAVVLTSPADNAMNQSVSPNFAWGAATGAITYLLEVATDSGFNDIVISQPTSEVTLDAPAPLLSSTTYYWRITASNGCGVSSPSQTFSFITIAAPGDCSIDQVANVLYEYDFESGLNGWSSTSNLNPAGSDLWSESGVNANSGTTSMLAVDVANVSDQLLTSPPVLIPADEIPISMSFWNRQVIEDNVDGTICWDGGFLEVSIDNGANFTYVTTDKMLTDPYDAIIDDSFSNPAANTEAWCGDPQDWLNSIVDFNDYAGETVMFRFRMATDSSISHEGWYIDDVRVQSCVTPQSICDAPPPVGDKDIIWFNGFQCVEEPTP